MKNFFKIKSKSHDYPNYWIAYDALFYEKKDVTLTKGKFVVFDTETTGFNFDEDRVLSIGAVGILDNEINIADTLEIYISQQYFNETTVPIHGILKNERIHTYTEKDALKKFLKYIGNSVLVAHHASFDVTMINQMLFRRGLPKLKNKVIDTAHLYKKTRIRSNLIKQGHYSLDEIAENYALDVSDRHTAAGDAFLTAIIFLKTTAILNKKKNFRIKNYLR